MPYPPATLRGGGILRDQASNAARGRRRGREEGGWQSEGSARGVRGRRRGSVNLNGRGGQGRRRGSLNLNMRNFDLNQIPRELDLNWVPEVDGDIQERGILDMQGQAPNVPVPHIIRGQGRGRRRGSGRGRGRGEGMRLQVLQGDFVPQERGRGQVRGRLRGFGRGTSIQRGQEFQMPSDSDDHLNEVDHGGTPPEGWQPPPIQPRIRSPHSLRHPHTTVALDATSTLGLFHHSQTRGEEGMREDNQAISPNSAVGHHHQHRRITQER